MLSKLNSVNAFFFGLMLSLVTILFETAAMADGGGGLSASNIGADPATLVAAVVVVFTAVIAGVIGLWLAIAGVKAVIAYCSKMIFGGSKV